MKSNRIGETSVSLTTLGFGGAPLGNLFRAISDDVAEGAISAAWDAGVRYFDTAPHYGLGLSERRLGVALSGRRREDYAISTKVGRRLVANPFPTGSDLSSGGFVVPDDMLRVRDYSRGGIRCSLEGSIERLRVDFVDIAFVHDPDDFLDETISQAIPALVELRDAGAIRAVGVGMNSWEPLMRIVIETDVDVVMLAGRWTLLDRSGAPLLAECLRRGIAVIAAAPFNSGLLAHSWPPDGASFNYAEAPLSVLNRARILARICESHGISLPHAAVLFALRHPAVVGVVAGVRSAVEARNAASWAASPIPDDVWEDLSQEGTSDSRD